MTAARLAFSVPGPPVAKERPLVVRDRRTGRMHGVTRGRTAEAEARILSHFKAAYPHQRPLGGRLGLRVTFHVAHRRRVDASNLQKTVEDALNGRAYLDDSQIDAADVRVIRGVSAPRTEIEIWTLTEGLTAQ